MKSLALALCALLAAACVDLNSSNSQVVTWEAHLVPELTHPDLTGQVAAAAQGAGGTDLGIGIEGAAPGAAHLWGVWSGTCGAPGGLLGSSEDYPALAVNDSGTASTETHIGPRLLVDSSYHAELRESASNATRIACGNLQQR